MSEIVTITKEAREAAAVLLRELFPLDPTAGESFLAQRMDDHALIQSMQRLINETLDRAADSCVDTGRIIGAATGSSIDSALREARDAILSMKEAG